MKKIILILIPFCFLISGCFVLWTDDVFLGTLFKEVETKDVELIAEPNYIQMGGAVVKSKNNEIGVYTPAGSLTSGGSN